ncbi:hypothetical protein RHSIM_Rhsim05G0089800 [Rhododendron simsii]|uniref:DUF2828 domain-containing protein n=1 Tax=Rhododendron simsii TaxID=118357 RepID=A0A834H9H2_RHOSS|nr:hypothetical protein RHSIM_Rhsim05G0089800 [Rhododendron simsii]
MHERVSDLFAEALKSYLEFLKSGEAEKVSFASEYYPFIDSPYDKSTLVCKSIVRKIFPRGCNPLYEKIEEAHYAYRVRERLRKEVLVPLHESLRRKKSLSQSKTSVGSRNKTKGVDKRFRFYVWIATEYANVWNGSSLLAHHFISAFQNLGKRLEEDLLKRENLKNSIAVCNTSGARMQQQSTFGSQ